MFFIPTEALSPALLFFLQDYYIICFIGQWVKKKVLNNRFLKVIIN